MDDQAVIERLRSDLRAERASRADITPDRLLDASRRRSHQRQVRRRAGAGLAAVVLLVVGIGLVAGRSTDEESVETGPAATTPLASTTTTLIPVATTAAEPDLPTGPASQSPEDAARDGVVPAVAELPFPLRVATLAEAVAPEGRWVISRPSDALNESLDNGRLGATDGTYMVDWIHASDAAEVLLIGSDDQIVRAYPMSQASTSWLLVTPDAVLGGRRADGGQPYFTLFRIDRRTLALTGMVFRDDEGFPTAIEGMFPPTVAPSWRIAPDGTSLDGILHEDPARPGTPVTSAVGGDYRLDVPAAEALLAEG